MISTNWVVDLNKCALRTFEKSRDNSARALRNADADDYYYYHHLYYNVVYFTHHWHHWSTVQKHLSPFSCMKTLFSSKVIAIHHMQFVISLLPLRAQEGERDCERDSKRQKRKRIKCAQCQNIACNYRAQKDVSECTWSPNCICWIFDTTNLLMIASGFDQEQILIIGQLERII